MDVQPGGHGTWRIGCAGFLTRRSVYFSRFRTVEVQETFHAFPAERTLARWRREAPEGFAFTLRACQWITHRPVDPGFRRGPGPSGEASPAGAGLFRPTEAVRRGWEKTEGYAEILDAKAIVFRTPASFTPTRENKENLVRFFHSIRRRPWHLVWEPDGIWEDEETRDLCRECGLVAAVDPWMSKPVTEGAFYFRIREKSRVRGGYTVGDFFEIRQRAIEGGGSGLDGFFIWNTPEAVRDASRFQEWYAQQAVSSS